VVRVIDNFLRIGTQRLLLSQFAFMLGSMEASQAQVVVANVICIMVDLLMHLNYDYLYATPPTGLSFGDHAFNASCRC
jgi:hypothetical protein